MAPMIDDDEEVVGLFQLFNYRYGSLNLNTVKKMKAITKFLGGCTAKVSQNAENMLVKVGLGNRMDKVS